MTSQCYDRARYEDSQWARERQPKRVWFAEGVRQGPPDKAPRPWTAEQPWRHVQPAEGLRERDGARYEVLQGRTTNTNVQRQVQQRKDRDDNGIRRYECKVVDRNDVNRYVEKGVASRTSTLARSAETQVQRNKQMRECGSQTTDSNTSGTQTTTKENHNKQHTAKKDECQGAEDKKIRYFPVSVLKDVVIPARSEAIMTGALESTATDAVLMIEPADVPIHGVTVARVTCQGRGNVPVRLMNVTHTEVTVKARTIIGYAHEVEETAIKAYENIPARHNQPVRRIDRQDGVDLIDQIDMSHLDADVKVKLQDLLIEYADVFRKKDGKLSCTTRVKHRIITEDVMPIAKRPYKVPFSQREVLQKEMQSLLDNDIITPSASPWSAPVVLVQKKRHPGEEPEVRVCIDYRGLNAVTKTDYFPLPHLQDTIDQLSGSSLFSTMDLASGYFQVELDERDREKSAFSTPFNHYEFKRMPMGLKNSPATWQRMMYAVLSGLTGQQCLVYLDDIIVYSGNNVDEHLLRLKAVFERLRESQLTLKPTKCNFLQREAHYLGHIITSEGCRTDPEKTRVIKNYPQPRNVKDIRAFLGLCGFYRKFVPKFSEIAQPMSQLTKKNVPFVWTDKQENAFNTLKTALSTPPVLKYPDFSKPFILATDASGIAISGILSQKHDGFEHPIAYTSRTLHGAETRYSTIEQELLAVVYAIKQFRCYLTGTHFTLITDHAPLRYLLSLKDPSSRLSRWALSLMEYDFEVQHRPGRLNTNADALSRVIIEPDTSATTNKQSVRAVNQEDEDRNNLVEPMVPVVWDREAIKAAQHKDTDLLKIINSVKRDGNDNYYMDVDNVLLKTREGAERHDKIVAPRIMRNKIMSMFHDPPTVAHCGYAKTLELIRRHFYWKGMASDIKKYCDGCHSCSLRKPGHKTKATLQRMPVPEEVFGMVAIDIVGPLNRTRNGNKYILTCMDYLSRYPECIPLPDIHASTVAKAFATHVIARHGAPKALLSDCGTQFVSKLFKELCKILNIEKLQTTSYRPECNGMIERMHRTMKTMLSHFVTNDQDSWDEWLPFIMMAYRNTVHKSTNETPFFLMHGRDMELPFHTILTPHRVPYDLDENYVAEFVQRVQRAHQEAAEKLNEAGAEQQAVSAKKARNKEYQVGDKVYLYTPAVKATRIARKFAPKWSGPYRVTSVLGPVTYKIKEIYGNKQCNVHVNRLKPCKGPVVLPPRLNHSESDDSDTDNEQSVVDNDDDVELDIGQYELVGDIDEVPAGVPEAQADNAPARPLSPRPHHTRSQGPVPDLPWVLPRRI